MKKLILTIALAASGLGGLATSAQAHGHEHSCYGRGYCFPSFTDGMTTIADTGIGRTVADSGTLLATAANQPVAADHFARKR